MDGAPPRGRRARRESASRTRQLESDVVQTGRDSLRARRVWGATLISRGKVKAKTETIYLYIECIWVYIGALCILRCAPGLLGPRVALAPTGCAFKAFPHRRADHEGGGRDVVDWPWDLPLGARAALGPCAPRWR